MSGSLTTRRTGQKRAHTLLDDGLDQGIFAGDQQPQPPSGKYLIDPAPSRDDESIVEMLPPFLSDPDYNSSIVDDYTLPSCSKDDSITPLPSPALHSNIGAVDFTAPKVYTRRPAMIGIASSLGKYPDADESATPRPAKRPNRMAAENGIMGQQSLDSHYDPLPLSEDHRYSARGCSSIAPSLVVPSSSRIGPGFDHLLKQPSNPPTVDYYRSIRVGFLEPPVPKRRPVSAPNYLPMHTLLSPLVFGSSPAPASDLPVTDRKRSSKHKPSSRKLAYLEPPVAFRLAKRSRGLSESASEDEGLPVGYCSGISHQTPERLNSTPYPISATIGRSLSVWGTEDGTIKPTEVQVLFKIFFEKLNPPMAILDPTMHTAGFYHDQSLFLFATICAVSSRYYQERPQLYPIAMRFAEQLASKAFVGDQKAVEIVQAFILLSAYPIPAHIREEDQTQTYLGFAIKMAVELHLHLPATRTAADEEYERDHLNKNRTWLICCNMIQSRNIQFGWPSTINENGIMRDLQGWYKLSKYNATTDIHLVAYTQVRSVVSRFLTNISPDYEAADHNLDLLTMTVNSNSELMALEQRFQELFERVSDRHNSACEYRCKFFFLLIEHSRLVLFSFGYQQAMIHGLEHSKMFSNQCFEAASKVLQSVTQDLAPSGWLMYGHDEHFVFISFAAAFLLRMLQSPFASTLDPTQSNIIIPLVTNLTRILGSDDVAVDDQHTPRLYSRFLDGLIAKQSWTDKFLLPGFNANFPNSTGGPPVDMRQWYIMNRGAVFPGVGTSQDVTLTTDASQGPPRTSQKSDLASKLNSLRSASDLCLQLKNDSNSDAGSAEPGSLSPRTTRFMVSI
ncbi:hypothetical protein FRC09_010480 [Ceratobasidium sp. 395]|nr:hypothetical protein FRC09_010480 [Ceratobasidium sp. 395]